MGLETGFAEFAEPLLKGRRVAALLTSARSAGLETLGDLPAFIARIADFSEDLRIVVEKSTEQGFQPAAVGVDIVIIALAIDGGTARDLGYRPELADAISSLL